jgi:hypothetical protein
MLSLRIQLPYELFSTETSVYIFDRNVYRSLLNYENVSNVCLCEADFMKSCCQPCTKETHLIFPKWPYIIYIRCLVVVDFSVKRYFVVRESIFSSKAKPSVSFSIEKNSFVSYLQEIFFFIVSLCGLMLDRPYPFLQR